MTDEIAIGHLQKRKIEARVLIPFITTCREKFGEGPTREAIAATIRALAAEEGATWAGSFGSDVAGLRELAETVWAGGGGLDTRSPRPDGRSPGLQRDAVQIRGILQGARPGRSRFADPLQQGSRHGRGVQRRPRAHAQPDHHAGRQLLRLSLPEEDPMTGVLDDYLVDPEAVASWTRRGYRPRSWCRCCARCGPSWEATRPTPS